MTYKECPPWNPNFSFYTSHRHGGYAHTVLCRFPLMACFYSDYRAHLSPAPQIRPANTLCTICFWSYAPPEAPSAWHHRLHWLIIHSLHHHSLSPGTLMCDADPPMGPELILWPSRTGHWSKRNWTELPWKSGTRAWPSFRRARCINNIRHPWRWSTSLTSDPDFSFCPVALRRSEE